MTDPSTDPGAPPQPGEPENRQDQDQNLRRFPRAGQGRGGPTMADVLAIVLSLLWLVLAGGFFLFGTGNGTGNGSAASSPLTAVLRLVAVVLPLALIWVAAAASRTVRALKAETRRLQDVVEAMRAAQGLPGPRATLEPRPDPRRPSDQPLPFTSRRETAPAPEPQADEATLLTSPDPQSSLALGSGAEASAPRLSHADLIRALNFPDSHDDHETVAALRRALDDRSATKLIRAAQDVLTLLGQDGIYMDDLEPDRARPEVWRRFAEGERGRAVAGLGGVRDRSSLALSAARMRSDTIFRDAAHHFLRQFDRGLTAFAPEASDAELAAFAETRTARAFMLLGRVAGTFD
jgi:hypothetical protein